MNSPDSKVHWANMEPTWVMSAPDGPHVGQMNLAIGESLWPDCLLWYPFLLFGVSGNSPSIYRGSQACALQAAITVLIIAHIYDELLDSTAAYGIPQKNIMMTSWHGSHFLISGHLWVESTGCRLVSLAKVASKAMTWCCWICILFETQWRSCYVNVTDL